MKRWSKVIIAVSAATCGAVLLTIFWVQFAYRNEIYSLDTVPALPLEKPIGVVLGASVKNDGTPSDALRDRLDVALTLYNEHKLSRVLLTGDDGKFHDDEIDAMKTYITDHGVTSSNILIDPTGYRTYESCKHVRALDITQAVLITQRFHMGRALYLCENMGVHSIGVTADLESYRNIVYFWTRDLLASAKAWWDINIWPPKPPVS